MAIDTVATFDDIAICIDPEGGNAAKVRSIAEVRGRIIDQIAWIEIIPPGVAVHSCWRRRWCRWRGWLRGCGLLRRRDRGSSWRNRCRRRCWYGRWLRRNMRGCGLCGSSPGRRVGRHGDRCAGTTVLYGIFGDGLGGSQRGTYLS